jgi:branched-chain amino acid transport system substrate-binding protein
MLPWFMIRRSRPMRGVTKECANGRLFRRILLMSFLYGCLFAPHLQAEPVKVAVLLPFSGLFKDLGLAAKNGFLLGLKKEANEAKVNIASWVTFDFLDDQADPEHSLELAKKVIGEGARAILGMVSSAVALQLKEYVLHEAQVPFIVFAAAGTTELRNTHPLFLRTSFSNHHAGIGLASWITEHPVVPSTKPRWVCIHADIAGPDYCNGFALLYKQIGEEIGRVPVPFKSLETKPQLVELAKLQPDFAFAFFGGADAAVFVQDYYRFKIHEKIPHSTELRGRGSHHSAKASRGEDLDIEEPVACRYASAFHFHTTLSGMLGAMLIRDEIIQMCEPREKRLLAPSWMMEPLHRK